MLTSKENNKALENLNDKLLDIMIDRGIIAFYCLSPLSQTTNLQNISHFNLVIDSYSIRFKDLLIHNTVPVTLNDNFLNNS